MFKNKSAYYDLYRPNYPYSLVTFLKEQNLLKNNNLVAEFGSGTGKLTGLLLENGNLVYGIEQDEEMQDFLQNKFYANPNFTLVKKTAENTGLSKNKFDLIIAAQSFHLFNPIKAKDEFYRILKPNGKMVFVWYHWDITQEVTQKIQNLFSTFRNKQQQQERTQIGLDFFNRLFYPNVTQHNTIDTITQKLSETEFLNSMLSSSYATTQDDKLHNEYLEEVKSIFNHYEKLGYIEYSFNLEAYFLNVEQHTKVIA
ncbi:MAG: class I SAM-dependent methyltransferase [Candidatus Limimorpha sp.]